MTSCNLFASPITIGRQISSVSGEDKALIIISGPIPAASPIVIPIIGFNCLPPFLKLIDLLYFVNNYKRLSSHLLFQSFPPLSLYVYELVSQFLHLQLIALILQLIYIYLLLIL